MTANLWQWTPRAACKFYHGRALPVRHVFIKDNSQYNIIRCHQQHVMHTPSFEITSHLPLPSCLRMTFSHINVLFSPWKIHQLYFHLTGINHTSYETMFNTNLLEQEIKAPLIKPNEAFQLFIFILKKLSENHLDQRNLWKQEADWVRSEPEVKTLQISCHDDAFGLHPIVLDIEPSADVCSEVSREAHWEDR